ncbi:ATP-binding cassette domain-containing protein [Kineococcus glutinatus]|uniref:ABC transporter domain-containing protein n=1 Tax=Kineococcus glutinatus TaxID=1070872 RepID=A0ABP8VF10_9ACTN
MTTDTRADAPWDAPGGTDAPLTAPRVVVRHGTDVLVDVIDLRIEPGRALTVVGESGSGKSVLAHALMGTLPRELHAEGVMSVGGTRFDLADRAGRRRLWGRHLALLPQEPALALDPTMRVRAQVAEGGRGRTPCPGAWPSAWRTPPPPSAARGSSSWTSRPRGWTRAPGTASPTCSWRTWTAVACC